MIRLVSLSLGRVGVRRTMRTICSEMFAISVIFMLYASVSKGGCVRLLHARSRVVDGRLRSVGVPACARTSGNHGYNSTCRSYCL